MIEELLKEWEELQKIPARTVGDIKNKANCEIAIAESLKQAGYMGELNGFSLQFCIDDRQRNLREMNDRLNRL